MKDGYVREDLKSPLCFYDFGLNKYFICRIPFLCMSRSCIWPLQGDPPPKKKPQRYNGSTCNCRAGIRKSERLPPPPPHSFLFSNPKTFGTNKSSILNPNKTNQGNIPIFHTIQTLATTLTSNESCGVDKYFRCAQGRLKSIIGPRAKQCTVEIQNVTKIRSENHVYFH